MTATLHLEDGTTITGTLFGSETNVAGEVGKSQLKQGPIFVLILFIFFSLIGYSHYSGECASVRIDAHSRIRTIHTTATMRSEAHSMSKRSESRIRLLYPNSRIRFASLRYLALV